MIKLRIIALILSVGLSACSQETEHAQQPAKESTSWSPDRLQQLTQDCNHCHGKTGLSSKLGTPHLAGLNKDFLSKSLRSYVTGLRKDLSKKKMFEKLNNAEINQITAYYASQTTPWKNLVPIRRYQAPSSEQLSKARALLNSCVDCHGESGNSRLDGIPSLAGLHPNYIKASVNGYFTKQRNDTIMNHFNRAIDQDKLELIARYYGNLKREKSPVPIKGGSKGIEKIIGQCIGCHGANGNSIAADIPSLAGHNQTYLINSMLAYRNGKRFHKLMNKAVMNLSKKQITRIAAYFAGKTPMNMFRLGDQDLADYDPLGDGKLFAATCDGCHGLENGYQENTPNLTQLSYDYLMLSMQAYTSGQRHHEAMEAVLKHLDITDLEKVALYYSNTQPQTAAQQLDPKKIQAGTKLAESCNYCHGKVGNSEDPKIPSLAGQNYGYLMDAMRQYQKKTRDSSDMSNALADLNKEQLEQLASYFASAPPHNPKPRIMETPEQLASRCDRCHGADGLSSDDNVPRIAGQNEVYLAASLNAYKDGKREHSMMLAMTSLLSQTEIHALSKYYANK